MGLFRHHALFLLLDGEQFTLFLVQDEISEMERQRSKMGFLDNCSSKSCHLPLGCSSFLDGTIHFDVNILRE